MNNKLLTQLKILRLMEIKPNFSELARIYDTDRRTIKKYYDGYEGKPSTHDKPSKLDPYKELIKEKLEERFRNNYEKEKAAKMTLYGPHRDDFEFCLADDNLHDFGSQGQQKMAILTLKLSEIEVFSNYKKTSPIILLDDVFSDLDIIKRNNLLKHIKKDHFYDDIKSIETVETEAG